MAQKTAISGSNQTKSRKASPVFEQNMKLSGDIFNEETVRCLVDEWIVPALVEAFLRSKNMLPDSESSIDNRDPL